MKFDIVTRLRNPPFGTETSERNIMFTAADEIEMLRSRSETLEAALTPSAETKCAYSGEFKISFPDTQYDEDEEEYVEVHREIMVPWTTVKQIMKAIKARAALPKG